MFGFIKEKKCKEQVNNEKSKLDLYENNIEQFFDIKFNLFENYESQLENPYEYFNKLPSAVIEKTKNELNIDNDKIKKLFITLIDYFNVVIELGHMEMDREDVDILWHNFILDTKSYLEFCLKCYGKFIHHNPYVNKKSVNKIRILKDILKANSSFKRKRKLNIKYFEKNDRVYVDDLNPFLPLYILDVPSNVSNKDNTYNFNDFEKNYSNEISGDLHKHVDISYLSNTDHNFLNSNHSSCGSSNNSSSCSSNCGS